MTSTCSVVRFGFGAAVLLAGGCHRPAAVAVQTRPAEVATRPSIAPDRSVILFWDSPVGRTNLSHNTVEAVRQELMDARLMGDLARAFGFSERDIADLRLGYDAEHDWFSLDDYGAPFHVFEAMSSALRAFPDWRARGHTREFILTSFRDSGGDCHLDGLDLRPLLRASHEPMPVSLFRKVPMSGAGADTWNGRAVVYVVVDREVARVYSILLNENGVPDRCFSKLVDAKEYDPRFKDIIAEVNQAVDEQLKKEGRGPQLGLCHEYWRRKKEMLKQKGVEWRSPSELNPNTCFD